MRLPHFLAASLLLLAPASEPLFAQAPAASIPWDGAPSASEFSDYAAWMPKMAALGMHGIRLFPEWVHFEPAPGQWRWDRMDAMVQFATGQGLEINGVLMGSIPWSKEKIHTFPMSDLDAWSAYVAGVVAHYQGRITNWEVWNEGNGGFNAGHHTTEDYARLAAATYTAAKKASPQAMVGLSVASYDAPYLQRTIQAMAKNGQPDSFDHLCVHPYEVAGGLSHPDGEIPFLWMTSQLRAMLKKYAPARAAAPIWITEIGAKISAKGDVPAQELAAARLVAKGYTLALAQGVARIGWFEPQDPKGEEPGYGLLKRDGAPRPSFHAYQTLTKLLGTHPKYVGWLALGAGGRGYGFVFEGAGGAVFGAWAPAGETVAGPAFQTEARITDGVTGAESTLAAGQPLLLTDAPVWVSGFGADLVEQARGQAGQAFPWGGRFAGAAAVHWAPAGGGGLFLAKKAPQIKTFPDGSSGVLIGSNESVRFWTHPTFAGLDESDFYIRLTLRRTEPGNVGMNLWYEAADTQGKMPYRNVGQWFSLGAGDDWQTHTWHITKASLAKMWGSDFYFQPEQSKGFAVGKVEVSQSPFAK